jgi:hypothetical protein
VKAILELSLINCHAMGMDSIVFKASAPMIRAFVCRPSHTLWRNASGLAHTLSVAIHQHRQDITMVPVHGEAWNVSMCDGEDESLLHAYEYDSQILDGVGGFRSHHERCYTSLRMDRLDAPRFLRGQEFHTVYVPQGRTAAWLICEGAPHPRYTSLCWTNDAMLDVADFTGMYEPMTEERLEEDLAIMSEECR